MLYTDTERLALINLLTEDLRAGCVGIIRPTLYEYEEYVELVGILTWASAGSLEMNRDKYAKVLDRYERRIA